MQQKLKTKTYLRERKTEELLKSFNVRYIKKILVVICVS